MPCDALLSRPEVYAKRVYIVNTDPSYLPGHHWLGLWTENNRFELMDSYGLPLHSYPHLAPFLVWLNQWKYGKKNDQTLQAIETSSCGNYALLYLMCKA